MRTRVVLFLAASILLGVSSANASSWRDLRIDASSDSRFDASIQQMRDQLPYHKALLFVIVLKDLKTHLAPADYRQRLDGLTYKEIAHLASPNATAEYLAHYSGAGAGAIGTSCPCDGGAVAPAFYGGSWSGSTVGGPNYAAAYGAVYGQ